MRTILVYGLKNTVGGIEKYLMNMHKCLCERMVFVFLIEKTEAFMYEQEILNRGGIIEQLPERHNLRNYSKEIRKVFCKYKGNSNLVYVNVGHISFDIIPIKLALSEGYRVVTHSHSAMQEPIPSFFYRARQSVLRNIGMRQLRKANVERLAVSKRAGDYLYKGRTYEIVSPGIEVDKFVPNEGVRRKLRSKYGYENAVVLGFVGRIVAVKNPLFLIDVLLEARQMNLNAKLMIVGDGAMMNEMRQRVEDAQVTSDVIFVGEVDNVQDYYQAMDVLLAPSFSEGMPLGIMEAQSVGLPCICAKGNFPDTIDVTGMVCFCDLNSGKQGWSNAIKDIVAVKHDKELMNEIVRRSSLNIVNAAERLFEFLR